MDFRRIGLFLVGLLPTAAVLLSKDPVNISGQIAVLYLLLTTSVTLGQKLFRTPAVKYRRQLGLWSAWFILLHVSNYLIEGGITKALNEWTFDYQLIGWVTFVIIAVLALTSTRWSQKKLRANWARLHKLSYFAIGMAIIHGVTATKLGWYTMWPFALVAVTLFFFKKPTAQIIAMLGVLTAYVLIEVPEPATTLITDNGTVHTEIVIPNDVVSISCVNGKELVYYADGTSEYENDCSTSESLYEIRAWDGIKRGLVTKGVYDYGS